MSLHDRQTKDRAERMIASLGTLPIASSTGIVTCRSTSSGASAGIGRDNGDDLAGEMSGYASICCWPNVQGAERGKGECGAQNDQGDAASANWIRAANHRLSGDSGCSTRL